MTRILGISGSLRRDSHNTNLLRAASEASGLDVELDLYDGLKEVPPFDEDEEVQARPVSVARLNRRSQTRTRCSSRRRSTTRPFPGT